LIRDGRPILEGLACIVYLNVDGVFLTVVPPIVVLISVINTEDYALPPGVLVEYKSIQASNIMM